MSVFQRFAIPRASQSNSGTRLLAIRSLAASDGELDSPEENASIKSEGNRSNPNLLQIKDGPDIGRVSSWAVSFERLLQDELGLDCFTKFLKREFSEENIMFWIACETMSKMTNQRELKRMADHIYSKHLSDEASMPVNLDSSCRLKVVQALKSPTPEMFKIQQQQIFKLMKYDSYSRFLKSKVYQDCLLAEMGGNPLPISLSRQRSDGTSFGSASSVDDTPENSKKGTQQKGSKKKYLLWKTSKSYSLEIHEESPDKKRKSLLPWINRAKVTRKISKEVDGTKESDARVQSPRRGGNPRADPCMNGNAKAIPVEGTCRLVFPNNDVVVLPARAGFTVHDVLSPHLEVRQLNFQSVETFLADSKEIVDFNQDMSNMAGAEIIVEQRVVFKIELPSHRVIGVKSKPSKKLIEVLRPVTYKYNLLLDALVVHLSNSPVPFDLDITVASLDGQRILIETLEQYGAGHYKAQARVDPGTINSAASVIHKSVSVESFIQKNQPKVSQTVQNQRRFSESGTQVKEATSARGIEDTAVTLRPSNSDSLMSKRHSQNRNHRITSNDAEELYTMLSKAQRRRMDDQRGLTIRNLELPDFLKKPDKETLNPRSKSSMGAPYHFNTSDFLISYESNHHADKKLRFRDMSVRCKSTPPTPSNTEIGFREGIIPSHSQAEAVFGGRGRSSDILPQTFNESMTAIAGDAYGYDESDVDMIGYGLNSTSMFHLGDIQRNHKAKLSPRAYPTDPFIPQVDDVNARARGYSVEIYDANISEEHCDDQVLDLDQTLTKSTSANESILPPPPDEFDRTLHLEEANYSPPPSLSKDEPNQGRQYSNLSLSLPDRVGTIQGSTLPGHSSDLSHHPLTDIDSVDFGTTTLNDDPPSPGPPSPSTHDLVMTPNFEDLSQGPFDLSYNFKQESLGCQASSSGRPDVLESLRKPEKCHPSSQTFTQQNTSEYSALAYDTSQYAYDMSQPPSYTSRHNASQYGTSEISASHYGSSQPNTLHQSTSQCTSETPSWDSTPQYGTSETRNSVDQGTSYYKPIQHMTSLQRASSSLENPSNSQCQNRMIANLQWKDGNGVQQQKIDHEKWETVVKDGRTMRATFV